MEAITYAGDETHMPMKYISEVYKELYTKLISELEKYAEHIVECLGDDFNQEDLIRVGYTEIDGLAEAIVYPRTSIVDGEGIVNPMFFYGYYVYLTENYNVKIKFTQNHQEFQEMLENGSRMNHNYLPKK